MINSGLLCKYCGEEIKAENELILSRLIIKGSCRECMDINKGPDLAGRLKVTNKKLISNKKRLVRLIKLVVNLLIVIGFIITVLYWILSS